MNITVNGEQRAVGEDATVAVLVSQVTGREILADGRAADGRRVGMAVARNATVIPRSLWSGTALEDGDELELVTAVQGG
ncbi:sulfur carrier protein [Arthrobacter woluwensis]|uniref:sulfur carrier protein ThiS n=1 Tax=Arthrobacter woluwensis TaxID=156980 RepID=UPI002780479F|nr:sulfur carrier protein ThiS [Arthrobacter woluwensis]MDQ0709460.1 sulfur carrier protein [Arthrobacter woluwensis]